MNNIPARKVVDAKDVQRRSCAVGVIHKNKAQYSLGTDGWLQEKDLVGKVGLYCKNHPRHVENSSEEVDYASLNPVTKTTSFTCLLGQRNDVEVHDCASTPAT